MNVITVERVRKYQAGYEVRDEMWAMGDEPPTLMRRVAYTPTGDYIGMSKFAYQLCKVRGIAPEKSDPEDSVCSIGFCEREQKWYGWSHRAIFGFGIGHIVEEGSCTAESGWTDEWLKDHPEDDKRVPVGFTATTLDDCHRLAVAFAESVS